MFVAFHDRMMRLVTAVSMRYPDALADVTESMFRMIHTDPRTDEGAVVVTEARLIDMCINAGIPRDEAMGTVTIPMGMYRLAN